MVIHMVEFGDNSGESIEEMISKVEQWAKDHPRQDSPKRVLEDVP